MNIRTEQHYTNQWSAIDDDTYDGPGSPIGWGATEAAAVADLIAWLEVYDREEDAHRLEEAMRERSAD